MNVRKYPRPPVPRALPADAVGMFRGEHEFCDWAGIGRTMFYEEAKAGRLIVSKIGRVTVVTFANARAWLNALPVRQVA
jgi:hypothetical protein